MSDDPIILLASQDGRRWTVITKLPGDEPLETLRNIAKRQITEKDWRYSRLMRESPAAGGWLVGTPLATFVRSASASGATCLCDTCPCDEPAGA